MTYFTTADLFATISMENQLFEVWIFIEGGMMVATIFSNIGFLAMRLLERIKIDIQPDDDLFDHHTDFLSTWSTQLIMNLTTLFTCPLLVSIFIRSSSYQNYMTEKYIWLLNFDIII